MTGTNSIADQFDAYGKIAARLVGLEDYFVKTQTYWDFRDRIFSVLEAREQRLKHGKTELKGAALIGDAGAGKSRIAQEIIAEYHAVISTGAKRQFGSRIVSIVVPGRATVKDTLKEILRILGYPITANRDEDYLTQHVVHHMKHNGVVALHLDEVQDSGRYKTSDSIGVFIKRFRNLMQNQEWPVCLILTATPEGRALVTQDPTLARRLRPIEMRPLEFRTDGKDFRHAIRTLLERADLAPADELLAQDEFIKILFHAANYRFGVAMEITIEAIGECLGEKRREIDIGDFAEAYAVRMDCDDELNPFWAENWSVIDTNLALQRHEVDHTRKRRRPKK
ncbi:TniB family NTP-binding protein [uncultured Martelella sp.]|uniref:TniB family NTP-binding protein n=1 Tax=uncultured Martelella sp. TaxID=392331 RepID=UPI0029C92F04|nr:TniB family NTP-binding protein [uncultured Martelella sp.]